MHILSISYSICVAWNVLVLQVCLSVWWCVMLTAHQQYYRLAKIPSIRADCFVTSEDICDCWSDLHINKTFLAVRRDFLTCLEHFTTSSKLSCYNAWWQLCWRSQFSICKKLSACLPACLSAYITGMYGMCLVWRLPSSHICWVIDFNSKCPNSDSQW
jgi:hypothetical protein